jgi:hypothetical protein
MEEQLIKETIEEIFSYLEPLDTQNNGLLEFLKAKGIATDEELAPYLEQAGNASNVRWLAARVRISSLISAAMRAEAEEPTEKKTDGENSGPTAEAKKEEAEQNEAEAPLDDDKSREGKNSSPKAEGDEDKKEMQVEKSGENRKQDAA